MWSVVANIEEQFAASIFMEGGQGSSYLWNVKSSELHCDTS